MTLGLIMTFLFKKILGRGASNKQCKVKYLLFQSNKRNPEIDVAIKPSHFFLNVYVKLNGINLTIDCGDQNKAIALK